MRNKQDTKQIAREKVNTRISFLSHFIIYVISISSFLGIDYFVTSESDWAYLPMFVWGIALFSHGAVVLFKEFFTDMKEKMIEKEAEKIEKKQKKK